MNHTLPMQTRMAQVNLSAQGGADRTFTVVWSTGAQVQRYDIWSDDTFLEEIDLAGARLERLNSGAPLLNTHQSRSLNSVIGVTERAWIENGHGMAQVRLSERAEVDPIWQDIQSGILRNISVGFAIHTVKRIAAAQKGDLDIVRITDFEPLELSLVPIPADARAQIRAAGPLFPVTVLEPAMSDAPTPNDLPPVDVDSIRAAAIAEERSRISTITRACAAAKLPELAANFIERGVSAADAHAAIIDEWAKRGGPELRPVVQITPPVGDQEAQARSLILKKFNGGKG